MHPRTPFRSIAAALTLASAICATDLHAQTSFDLIVGGGYERATLDGDFSGIEHYAWYDAAQGDAASILAGGWLRSGTDVGMLARVAASRLTAQFTRQLPTALVLLPGTTQVVEVGVEGRFPLTLSSLELDLAGVWMPLEWIGVGAGGAIGYRWAGEQESTQNLLGPVDARFSNPGGFPERNGGRTLVLDSGSVARDGLSAAAIVSLIGDVPLLSGLALVPEIRVRYDLSSPFATAGWQRVGVSGALSLRWSFLEGTPAPVEPELNLDAPAPSLDFHAVGPEGRRSDSLTIRPVTDDITLTTPILPVISSRLNGRLARPVPIDDARRMLDSVLRLPQDRRDEPMLLTGLQLLAHPEARVRLRPLGRKDDAEALATLEQMRSAVAAGLGVAPTRMLIVRSPAEGLGADVDDTAAAVLVIEPSSLMTLTRRWIERGHQSDAVAVEPRDATGPWRVILSQGARAYDTIDGTSFGNGGLRLRLPASAATDPEPLVARLESGDGGIVTDTLSTTVRRDGVARRRTIVELPGARERVIAGVTRVDLEPAASAIRDGDDVTVSGPESERIASLLREQLVGRRVTITARAGDASTGPLTLEHALLRERNRIVIESPAESSKP
jgi:hypothetical protein